MDYVRKFASTLSVARVRGKKKVDEMAKKTGVSTSKIRHWEAGDFLPNETELVLIKSVYSPDDADFDETYKKAREQMETDRKTLSRLGKKEKGKKTATEMFPGGIEVARDRARLNSHNMGKG